MKFTVTSDYFYWWPVTVTLPDPDPRRAGKTIEQTFKIQFKALPLDEAREIQKEIAALPPEERAAREHGELERVAIGWDDQIVDENDRPIPFSAEALHDIIQNSWVRIGLYNAYGKSLQLDGGRKGN